MPLFAAEIGSMKLNEEIDSLKTFGISPMEFLILPRTLSLIFMIPLLTIYADIIGILGGLTVGTLVCRLFCKLTILNSLKWLCKACGRYIRG